MRIKKLGLRDFADSFGCAIGDMSKSFRFFMKQHDFRYSVLRNEDRDKIVLDVLQRIELDQQRVGSKERTAVWQKGWQENLQAFRRSRYDLKALIPRFVRANRVMRLNGQYVVPVSPTFEWDFFCVFRHWLFEKYLKDAKTVYEFGCGTGLNLVALAKLDPEKELHGLDFSSPSQKILRKIRDVFGFNIIGHFFDMKKPKDSLCLKPNSIVLTFGAIEQLAGAIGPFLKYLKKNSPALCISMEPILELYDPNNLLDYLAIKFHTRRGYTGNYLAQLKDLENNGQVKILKVKRLFFGSTYMEGFSLVVWKYLKK